MYEPPAHNGGNHAQALATLKLGGQRFITVADAGGIQAGSAVKVWNSNIYLR